MVKKPKPTAKTRSAKKGAVSKSAPPSNNSAKGPPAKRALQMNTAPETSPARADAAKAVDLDSLKRAPGLDVITLRATTQKKRPTKLRLVDGHWMICYLQEDGSYAQCQPSENSEGLFRSAVANNVSDVAGNEGLYSRPEGDLFALLAAMAADPAKADARAASPLRQPVDADDARRGNDDFYRSEAFYRSKAATELGKRIFSRWSRAFHDFVCSPDAEDKDLKEKMLRAIFSKSGGGIAVVAGGLVAAFGLSPTIAAVVAALMIKLIVAPAMEEVCKAWGAQISSAAAK